MIVIEFDRTNLVRKRMHRAHELDRYATTISKISSSAT